MQKQRNTNKFQRYLPQNKVVAKKYVTDAGRKRDRRSDGRASMARHSNERQSFEEPNRQWEHLSSNHQDWANQMVGDALYRQTLMVMRNLGNGTDGRKIDSRKWVGGWGGPECGIQIGENGEDWETISVILRCVSLEDAFLKNVLVSPYEILEILMGHNREEGNPRRKLRIGTARNAGNVASINAMVETIDGVVGSRALVGENEALAARGHLAEMPAPAYGYVRGIFLLRERMEFDLCNDRANGNLGELTYTDRQGVKGHSWPFIRRLQWRSCRYHMRYTRGVEAKGDMRDRLEELQIDKVAAQKDTPAKQLEDGEIHGDLRSQLRRESWAEFWKDGKVIEVRRKIRRNDPC